MRPSRSDAELALVARLYYLEDQSQEEIAARLGTTRSNVSRILASARDRGIVRFEIPSAHQRHMESERSLTSKFGLQDARVLADQAAYNSVRDVGILAAEWLTGRVQPGSSIAVSWGRTLHAMIEALDPPPRRGVTVMQLGGGLQADPSESGTDLVRDLAQRLGGQHRYLHAPAIVDSADTLRKVRAQRHVAQYFDDVKRVDLAFVGIGAFGQGFAAKILDSAYLTVAESDELGRTPVVGDICARFFGDRGEVLETPLSDRVLALELDELKTIPTVVGVVAGSVKARAVAGALRGGYIDVLICDEAAASVALSESVPTTG